MRCRVSIAKRTCWGCEPPVAGVALRGLTGEAPDAVPLERWCAVALRTTAVAAVGPVEAGRFEGNSGFLSFPFYCATSFLGIRLHFPAWGTSGVDQQSASPASPGAARALGMPGTSIQTLGWATSADTHGPNGDHPGPLGLDGEPGRDGLGGRERDRSVWSRFHRGARRQRGMAVDDPAAGNGVSTPRNGSALVNFGVEAPTLAENEVTVSADGVSNMVQAMARFQTDRRGDGAMDLLPCREICTGHNGGRRAGADILEKDVGTRTTDLRRVS